MNLVRALAISEKEPPEVVKLDAASFARHAFGPRPVCRYIVATDSWGMVVAFAVAFIAYSTWDGPWVYLEDLFVSKVHRNQGLGGRLVQVLARAAVVAGMPHRIGWQVLHFNAAVRLYQRLGADVQIPHGTNPADGQWLNCRVAPAEKVWNLAVTGRAGVAE